MTTIAVSVATYRLVFPDGSSEDLVSSSALDGGDTISAPDGRIWIVTRVQPAAEDDVDVVVHVIEAQEVGEEKEPRVRLEKVVIFVVDGTPYPLTVEEATEIARRLRRLSGGDLENPALGAAVRIEQLIEETAGASPAVTMLESEKGGLRRVIWEWLNEAGAASFPERVMALRYALHRETAG